MRTLRGNITNENGEMMEGKNQSKSKKKADEQTDDDIGANGDDTTDDEGGVDTPPPPCDDDEDSKEDETNDSVDSVSNKKDEIKRTEKKMHEKKTKEKTSRKKNFEKVHERVKSELSEDGEYEVEQIVDMETRQRWKCPVKFRVRWVGFSEKEDTWLPASDLNCNELIQEFLEISGRKSEHERAFESKKKAAEWIADNCRQSARKISRITYSELDEDEEEILPSGTKSRKVKTKAEKKQMPVVPVKRKAKKSAVVPIKKSKPSEKEFEVESIAGMREVKGRIEYKIHWKNWSSKYDSWLQEEELNCPDILNHFKEVLAKLEKQDDWQVEEIFDFREKKGKKEYLVHWKGFESKSDTWEPEENLQGCLEMLKAFKLKKDKVKTKQIKEGRKVRGEKTRPERLVENYSEGTRSRSKRRSAATSYSEFYEQ